MNTTSEHTRKRVHEHRDRILYETYSHKRPRVAKNHGCQIIQQRYVPIETVSIGYTDSTRLCESTSTTVISIDTTPKTTHTPNNLVTTSKTVMTIHETLESDRRHSQHTNEEVVKQQQQPNGFNDSIHRLIDEDGDSIINVFIDTFRDCDYDTIAVRQLITEQQIQEFSQVVKKFDIHISPSNIDKFFRDASALCYRLCRSRYYTFLEACDVAYINCYLLLRPRNEVARTYYPIKAVSRRGQVQPEKNVILEQEVTKIFSFPNESIFIASIEDLHYVAVRVSTYGFTRCRTDEGLNSSIQPDSIDGGKIANDDTTTDVELRCEIYDCLDDPTASETHGKRILFDDDARISEHAYLIHAIESALLSTSNADIRMTTYLYYLGWQTTRKQDGRREEARSCGIYSSIICKMLCDGKRPHEIYSKRSPQLRTIALLRKCVGCSSAKELEYWMTSVKDVYGWTDNEIRVAIGTMNVCCITKRRVQCMTVCCTT